MNYKEIIKNARIADLISMTSVDGIIRFGHSIELNEKAMCLTFAITVPRGEGYCFDSV